MSARLFLLVMLVGLLAISLVMAQTAPTPTPKPTPAPTPATPPKPRHPFGFKAAPGAQPESYSNTGWVKEIIHEKTGIEMVFIPAGQFTMGSPETEENRNGDELQHEVKITRPFYMGKYEVTQGQAVRVMGVNPSAFKGSERLPVDSVSWVDCQQFVTGLNKLCSSSSFHLPTEAQWEYACRAGSKTAFFFSQWNTRMDDYGWTAGNATDKKTHEVGQKKPNPWGLYDMHGNVWEWCEDVYDMNYYKTSPAQDPKGPAKGIDRVMRGGSWNDLRGAPRCALRHGFPAGNKAGNQMGMRIIYEIK